MIKGTGAPLEQAIANAAMYCSGDNVREVDATRAVRLQ